jgi:NAD(P)H-hydrate epimerase
MALGLPSLLLMENAGRGVAEALIRFYPDRENLLVLAGPGNNGGDGFVAARHWILAGRRASVLLAVPPERFGGDARIHLDVLRNMNVPILPIHLMDDENLEEHLRGTGLLLDALLGTGSAGALRGQVLRIAERLDRVRSPESVLVALDLPSGVDSTSGAVLGPCIKADRTLALLGIKFGTWSAPGALFSGSVEALGIGAPADLPEPMAWGVRREDLGALLPRRRLDAHKGNRGRVLVVGGSSRYRGAPLLAALGALRIGAGLVTLVVPESIVSGAFSLPEAIWESAPEVEGGLGESAFDLIEPILARTDAVVLGPGLGRSRGALSLVRRIWRSAEIPLVVDADALRALPDAPGPPNPRAVLTPHAGEAGALLGWDSARVGAERLEAASLLAGRYGTTILKGYRSLVCGPSSVRVIGPGGRALAIPGSGDTLSGAVAGLVAAGLSPVEAATTAALVHACAGDDLARSGGNDGLLAREVADRFPRVMAESETSL